MPKILVYSQNLSDIDTVVNPLKEVGYIVSHINDSSELFNVASDFCADIVILSLNDKVDEVSKICRKIRLLDQSSDIQIILLLEGNESIQPS